MFREVSIIGFIVVFIFVILHYINHRSKLGDSLGAKRKYKIVDRLRPLSLLLTVLFIEEKKSLINILKKLIFLLALLCFAVLLVTGFVPVLVLGKTMSGYWLMLHATFAPFSPFV